MSATQDVLPTMDALLAAMSGAKTTSDWDVLVSYSVTKLNAILPSLWKGDTFNEVSFNRDYLDFGRRTAARLSIGAPTLQFVAGENAKALLTMKLQGWLRTDTLNVNQDTGEIISVTEGADNTKVNIEPGRYQLQAAVPLVNMSGDASGPVQEAGQTVVLGEKTSGSKIVFHFKSQNSVYNVTLAPGVTDKRKEDTHMADLGPRIAVYFQELNSLDYAIAGVQQPKNAADRDRVLTPESFVFTTQGSSPGVLCVYIQTHGSGNKPGWSTPNFQPNNNNVLPIPQGFTTSIIIRHDLFNDKYLIPQLKAQVAPGGLLHQLDKDDNFVNGFRYLMQLNPSALKNNKFGPGPWHNYDLNIDYEFTQPPLALTISNRSANWYWKFKDYRYFWWHYKSSGHGRIYIDVSLNANYPIASVTDEHLALKVDLQKRDFNLWIHPYNGDFFEKHGAGSAGWTDDLPDVMAEQCYFDINDLRLSREDFDFFATENVFAPGQHIIKVDSGQGMAVPHDILLVGDIVPPAVLGSHPALMALVASADGDGTIPGATSPSLARLKTLLFTDQNFVTKAFSALRDGKTQDFEKAVNDKQLTVSDSDVQTLQVQASVSPSFDIRLAAGVYKIDSPPSMVAVSMTISPLDGMISFDNVHVENQVTDPATGIVSWTTGQGANVFQATWTAQFDSSGNVKSMTFNGQTWPASQPTNTTPFTGSKITADSGSWFGSAAAQGASFVLSCVGVTALALAATILGVQALRKRNADPTPAVDAMRDAARVAANAVVRQVQETLRRERLEPVGRLDAVFQQRAKTTASEAASRVRIGAGESALTQMVEEIDSAVLRDSRRESTTELARRFGSSTLEILPLTALTETVDGQAKAIAERAVPPPFRQRLAQAEIRSAEAFQAAEAASANLASAAQALEEKQGVTERLRSERLAKQAELKELNEAGTDPRREATLRMNITELKQQIERAEREQAEAEASRDALEDRAKEAQAEVAKANKEVEDVKPEPEPGPEVEAPRR